MKSLHSVVIALALASVVLFAQAQNPSNPPNKTSPAGSSSGTTYRGTIVNATCNQASALPSMRAVSYADRGSATTPDLSSNKSETKVNKNPKSVYDIQSDIMRHCPANSKTSAFALLTDDGRFFKLDDSGNTQVKDTGGNTLKNLRVSIAGTLDGDTLKIQSLNKM